MKIEITEENSKKKLQRYAVSMSNMLRLVDLKATTVKCNHVCVCRI